MIFVFTPQVQEGKSHSRKFFKMFRTTDEHFIANILEERGTALRNENPSGHFVNPLGNLAHPNSLIQNLANERRQKENLFVKRNK